MLRDPQVSSEKEVVANERRQRVDDDVDGAVSELLYKEAFRKHAYGWPTIGWMEDIKGFTTEDCVAAGSSEKPAVSAGRPRGKTWRWTCWTCRSSRSSRCSGVGCGRWASAEAGTSAMAAMAAAAVIGRKDFTKFLPHSSM